MILIKLLLAGVLLYLAFALRHHKKTKSLTLEILLEYLLISALVLVILMGALT